LSALQTSSFPSPESDRQLIDTFDDARSEGRVHDAIDIPAPLKLPCLPRRRQDSESSFTANAAARRSINSAPIRTDLYYAHLSHYADGLAEGDLVRQGQVIAYVGDTGNAGAGNYHLHFSIATVTDPKRYWEGSSINPYPLLQNRAR
jgi:hypothetical protein